MRYHLVVDLSSSFEVWSKRCGPSRSKGRSRFNVSLGRDLVEREPQRLSGRGETGLRITFG